VLDYTQPRGRVSERRGSELTQHREAVADGPPFGDPPVDQLIGTRDVSRRCFGRGLEAEERAMTMAFPVVPGQLPGRRRPSRKGVVPMGELQGRAAGEPTFQVVEKSGTLSLASSRNLGVTVILALDRRAVPPKPLHLSNRGSATASRRRSSLRFTSSERKLRVGAARDALCPTKRLKRDAEVEAR
jgi:hypothetical protein